MLYALKPTGVGKLQNQPKLLLLCMQKLLLFLLLACLSPALVGKPLTLPTDTINNHQIYLNKKPLLFANANMKKEELTISLAKKSLKNTDKLEVVYGTCTRSYEKHQLSLKNAQGKTVWKTSTHIHQNPCFRFATIQRKGSELIFRESVFSQNNPALSLSCLRFGVGKL
ncbi:MAG: hypothetical protein EAZ95_03155 [Bacteroidetes bacterium]|nr:MAG: hypothetical protein EAZ95_03155 [Bacteroidota bacterium]